MNRVLVRAIAATAIGAAAVGGVSVAASAATDSVQACAKYVAPPDSQVNGYVWVSGSRRGCTDTRRLSVELYRSYWGVDPLIKNSSATGVNFEVTAKSTCSEAGGHGEFYGKAATSGGGGTTQGAKNNEC
ncbi:hypothetical protein ACIA49_36310 [Kribbella sp. NPDC051587]|uniref:hypothetical protein n=1 Tax=Kribbella sp. NPDC051587 TaxID=3364119 RepID=UPI0037BCF6B7